MRGFSPLATSTFFPSTPPPLQVVEYHQAFVTTMCRWRQIQDTYTTCNHSYRLPDEMVYCPEKDCKFSPLHPSNCQNCMTTCWQYRRFPEIINRQFGRLCPRCEEVAASGRH